MTPTRHVSAAIKQLRFWVAVTASVVALSSGLRLATFGFVHYTDLSYVEIAADTNADAGEVESFEVVTEQTRRERELAAATPKPASPRSIVGVAGEQNPELIVTDDPGEHTPAHREPSVFGGVLATVGAASAATGVLATFLLAIVTILGLVVAAGGSVPGVEKTVTATVWAVLLALLCIPWRSVLPAVPLDGVFRPFTDMVVDSNAVLTTGAGELPLHFTYVGLPLVVVALAPIVLLWFRAGVENGVLVASTRNTEVDERLEREMADVRERLSVGSVSRSVGALNRVMDDEPRVSAPAAPISSKPSPAPAAAPVAIDPDEEALAFLRRRTKDDADLPEIGRPMRGDGMRRPI